MTQRTLEKYRMDLFAKANLERLRAAHTKKHILNLYLMWILQIIDSSVQDTYTDVDCECRKQADLQCTETAIQYENDERMKNTNTIMS